MCGRKTGAAWADPVSPAPDTTRATASPATTINMPTLLQNLVVTMSAP